MKRVWLRSGLMGIGLLAAANAGAADGQVVDQRDAVPPLGNPESENAAEVLRTFAFCFARQREQAAEELVALPYGSEAQGRRARRMSQQAADCLGNNQVVLGFASVLLAGGIAEYFLTTRYGLAEINTVGAMSDETIASAGLVTRNSYEMLSLCVIRRDPAAARAIVDTRPRSPEERAAFQRLVPNVAPCVPANFEMTFSRSALRALIAAGLYRVAAAINRPMS